MIPTLIYYDKQIQFPSKPAGIDFPVFFSQGKTTIYLLVNANEKKIIAIELHWGDEEQESWLDTNSDELQRNYHLNGTVGLVPVSGHKMVSARIIERLKNSNKNTHILLDGQKFIVKANWPGFAFAQAE